MIRRISTAVAILFSLATFCCTLPAQTEGTITVRMLDSRTGKPITPTSFLVRVDHEETGHPNWVTIAEDGTATLKLAIKASLLSIQGTYENSMDIYVNCDSSKEKPPTTRWYAIADVLTTGLVAPNACSKLKTTAKPGEYVFYVRKETMTERWKNF